jgi:alkylation response protein AidB-like acyl-CoA dehydrogenase
VQPATAAAGSAASILLSEEREEFRRSVRGFLERVSPEPEVRRLMKSDEGYDPDVWRQMAAQPALQGLAIAEEHGGGGFTPNELVIVFEEMGRTLFPSPFFSTIGLAATALSVAGDESAQAEHLPGIAAGETIATVALTEDSGRWDQLGVTLTASGSGPDYTLDGHKMYVTDGHLADLILVLARDGAAGFGIFAVAADAPGMERIQLETMDQTRKQARLQFAGTPARAIGPVGGWETVARVLDTIAVLLAAECAGGAARCLEMATEYANERVQFGRPIGSFQAIKHKCTDLLVEAESAKSAAYYAGWAAAEAQAGDPDGERADNELAIAAPLAKAYASEAFTHAAAENIQIHGGIGITWEHPAHLYLKRAKTNELLLGDPAYHRELLAQRVGI